MGSMKPTNNGAVANIVNANPTELTLMDAKKVTQWAATNNPMPEARSKSLRGHAVHWLLNTRKPAVVSPPMVTRQNTRGSASMVITLPKIPVNPNTTTMA